MHTIMLIPANLDVDINTSAKSLAALLITKNIRTVILPAPDRDMVEQFLANNREEDLLVHITKQHDAVSAENDVTLIQGLPLSRPYSAEINFSTAVSLGAAVIFVAALEQDFELPLRQLKIIINPYQYRYNQTRLGIMVPHNNSVDIPIIEKHKNVLNIDLPIISTAQNIINFTPIQKYLDTKIEQPITPATFKHRLIEKARHANKTIILPEGAEPRTIEAANICTEHGIANCILLEQQEKIYATCQQFNLRINKKIKIIEPQTVLGKYIDPLYETRKVKGLTIEAAKKQLEDNVILGTMMLKLGEVDGLVSGAIHTTANTIRPALQLIKTPPDVKLVSSIFFMCLPDHVTVFGDCAINPDPSPEELADIAIQSAKSAQAFGITPRIAMLSYSTGTSGFGPSVDKVRAATELAKSWYPDLEIEGPIQYDAAVSEETAKIKAPNSKVAGHATVFIMPNLDVGNIVYKAVQRNTGIVCVGPMLQGLKKPVNDLSRGCSVNDIVFTIAITAIQSLTK